MTIADSALLQEMVGWRRRLHAQPEFGFDEKLTASFVASTLRSIGVDDVSEGLGGTGVVGTLRRGPGNRAIGLRADMDGLRIQEQGQHAHRSKVHGVMHACGHDGHTAMLLGAAKLLAQDPALRGTVHLIFQPAEEWGRGALAMIADGLLTRFPMDEIYGLHNLPGLPIGSFETCVGPLMAAEDNFEIILSGQGGHSSRPHELREVMVAACATVINLQSIVSRALDPAQTAVVSVTELRTDGTRNVLPGQAHILGDARSFSSDTSLKIESEMRRIVEGIAASYQCDAQIAYTREFVPLVNHPGPTRAALTIASQIFEKAAVKGDRAPITASEDFARFLLQVPGCFAFIGNGTDSAPLHNCAYDFDDRSLLYGAHYFAALARDRTSEESQSDAK